MGILDRSSERKKINRPAKIFGNQLISQTDLRERVRKARLQMLVKNRVNNLRVQRTRQAV